MLTTKLAVTDQELIQIADLSNANRSDNISAEEKAAEGFVSWVYTPEILRTINAIAPSVIVMDEDILAGYAITLTPECLKTYPAATPTYNHAAPIPFKGRTLGEQGFYLMGQICVAKAWRGQGIVGALYLGHRQYYSPHYYALVTEISMANPRSLKAHQKIGFETIDRHYENGHDWAVVAWNWT
jgi:ribosomal protein S18 acetylase RimI-like enzyme